MSISRSVGARPAEPRSERLLQLLIEGAQDYAIFVLDPGGHVSTWNEGARRIKGWEAHEIIGQHFSRFYPAEDIAAGKCERELEGALRDGRFEDEGWRLRKDGSRFWANVIIAPLRDEQGRHVGFSKITRDLTERVKAERDREQLARSEEAVRLRDEFLSVAAHELRTPLAALQLQLESLRDQTAGIEPRQRARLDRATRNVQRLADLIATVLDVSRIAKGTLTMTPDLIDLGAVVEEVVDRYQDSARIAGCTVQASVTPGIKGWWDPLRVGQALTNVLSNAFKYAPGSRVEVKLVRDGGDAVLRVEDNGPGIPAEHLERVFGRFERAAPTAYGGMGLGLYLAREIVRAHGGTIGATNRPDGGLRVEMRMPIRETQSVVGAKEVS
jgi:PAS domain S-box-containing protein